MKECRRANGFCFKCGEKIAPNHQCAPPAELKTMELNEDFALLGNDFLEAKLLIVLMGVICLLIASSENSKCIWLQALARNQVFFPSVSRLMEFSQLVEC